MSRSGELAFPGEELPREPATLPGGAFGAGGAPIGKALGRYVLYHSIAAGGMASIHVGRMIGPAGFAKTVAIKRLHQQYALDPEFVAMFLDEARLAARVAHPNVVSTLDVVAVQSELFLIMDYVAGESLASLLKEARRRRLRIAPRVAIAIMIGVLYGLHAAHEARDEAGAPLGIVHRDVSPQNVMVGVDGVARVLDFGVAKATWRTQSTREGQLKGKLTYMAPEQLRHEAIDRRTDVYAAAVVLWEMLAARRLFNGDNPARIVNDIVNGVIAPPSSLAADVPAAVDAVVMRGLARDPSQRFPTALEMARALEGALAPGGPAEIGECVRLVADDTLEQRARRIAAIESAGDAITVDTRDGALMPGARARRAEVPTAIIGTNEQGQIELTRLDEAVTGWGATGASAYENAPVMHPPPARRRALYAAAGALTLLVAGVTGVKMAREAGNAPEAVLPAVTTAQSPASVAEIVATPLPTSPSPAQGAAPAASPVVLSTSPGRHLPARHLSRPRGSAVERATIPPIAAPPAPFEGVLNSRKD